MAEILSTGLPPLRLFHYWRSSASWRVRWALAHKGLVAEMIPVSLLDGSSESPDHLARNPMGYVPVLELLDSTGASGAPRRFLSESVAILEWLEENAPARPLLPPAGTLERAHTRQLVEVINSGTQPLQNLSASLAHSPDPAEQRRWNQLWIRKGLGAYEQLLAGRSGRFSIGDQLTLADLFLIPQCYAARRNEVPLEEFPTIARIHAQAIQLPSHAASEPGRFEPPSA